MSRDKRKQRGGQDDDSDEGGSCENGGMTRTSVSWVVAARVTASLWKIRLPFLDR